MAEYVAMGDTITRFFKVMLRACKGKNEACPASGHPEKTADWVGCRAEVHDDSRGG